MRTMFRLLLRVLVTCALLATALAIAGPQPSADAQASDMCLVAGNGTRELGPFPTLQPTKSGLHRISEVQAAPIGSTYVLAESSDGATQVVRVSEAGSAAVAAADGWTLAGRELGSIADIAIAGNDELYVLTNDPPALIRINEDRTQTDLTDLLPAAPADETYSRLSVSASKSIFVAVGFDGFSDHYRIEPDRSVLQILNRGSVFFYGGGNVGEGIEVFDTAGTDDGLWVSAMTNVGFVPYLIFVDRAGILRDVETYPSLGLGPGPISARPDGSLEFIINDYREGTSQLRQVQFGQSSTLIRNLDIAAGGRNVYGLNALDSTAATQWFASDTQLYRAGGGSCPSTHLTERANSCVVIDQTQVAALLPGTPVDYNVSAVAVDSGGTVYSAWYAEDVASSRLGYEAIVSTTRSGASSVVLQPGQINLNLLAPRLSSLAVSQTTNRLFALDSGRQLFERDPQGQWTELLRIGQTVDGATVDWIDSVAMNDNSRVYVSDRAGLTLLTTITGGPAGRFEVVPPVQGTDGVSLQPIRAGDTDERWAVDANDRLYAKSSRGYEQVIDLATMDIVTQSGQTRSVRFVWDLAVRNGDVIAASWLDNGEEALLRISPQGSVDPILHEGMLVDGRVIEVADPLAVGRNGDIYVSDRSNGRVVQLAATADCNSAYPPVASLAATVDCIDPLTNNDALLVLQHRVGSLTATVGCPLSSNTQANTALADINGDGAVSVLDALQIAQCTVGQPNPTCPAR